MLMCNFNYGDYVGQAIQSVLDQTMTDFQLVIVDDGSTDHSMSEIRRFKDSRILIISQENRGQAAAFNSGFMRCTGELIAFLDSDDWWLPRKLEAVLLAYRSCQEPIGLIQHQVDVKGNGHAAPYRRILATGYCFDEMKDTGFVDFFVPTSGITVPTENCKKIFPISESLKLSADAYITRTAVAFGVLLSIPETLGVYRKHANAVFENDTFDNKGHFIDQVLPLINNFYFEHDLGEIRIENALRPKPPWEPKRRSLIKRVYGRLSRVFQNWADA